MIPWLTRLPTPEEVAAHAKAHPVGPVDFQRGLWLRAPEHAIGWARPADLRVLSVIAERHISGDYRPGDTATARWLPCTAEGIPVCLLAFLGIDQPWPTVDVIRKLAEAAEHLRDVLPSASARYVHGDQHGYEEVAIACQVARERLALVKDTE